MIKKIFITLLLLGTFIHASSVPDNKHEGESISNTIKKDAISFDVNYVALLGVVNERFEQDYLVNAPKRLVKFGSLVTLSYNF